MRTARERHSRERGAALVEALVAIPFFIVIFAASRIVTTGCVLAVS